MVASVLLIVNLPMALRNLQIAANGLPLVPIGNDICVGLLNRQNPLSFTKVICQHSLGIIRYTPSFLKSSQNFDPSGLGFKDFALYFWN